LVDIHGQGNAAMLLLQTGIGATLSGANFAIASVRVSVVHAAVVHLQIFFRSLEQFFSGFLFFT
jgi:hypothetical protein